MRTVRLGTLALTVAALALSGCSADSGGGSTGPVSTGMASGALDANKADVKKGGTATYTVNVDPKSWNILSATGDVFGYRQIMNAILPSVMVSQPDFTMKPNAALLTSAKVINANPQTIEYKLRAEAVWNDGTPISADDFIYTWQTMNGQACPACKPSTTTGYSEIADIKGSDNGKTVLVTMKKVYQPWTLMFPYLLPSHVAKKSPDLATSFNEDLSKTVPTWSGGPYQIKNYTPGQSVTMVPNPKWYGEGPNLDTLIFRIITDDRQAVTAMANNEVQIINPTPTLDIVTQLKGIQGVEVKMASGLLYEHLDFNIKSPGLSDVKLRTAIFTAVDSKAVIAKTIGQFSPDTKPLGNRSFMPGQVLDGVQAYEDTVTPLGLGTGNLEAAKKILTDAGYKLDGAQLKDPSGANVGPYRMVHSKGNQSRKDQSVLFQSQLKQLGITLNLVETDSLGATVTNSDFDLIVYGTNLDVIPTRTTTSVFATAKPHTGYVDQEMNGWLTEAAQVLDAKKVVELLNKADKRLSEQAITLPLFQTPTVIAYRADLGNVRVNPTRFGTSYNTEQWGIKK